MVIDVSIEKMEHLTELLQVPQVDGVILPGDRMAVSSWKKQVKRCHDAGKKAYFAFPYVLRLDIGSFYEDQAQELRTAGFDGYLVRSLDAAGLLEEQGLSGLRIFDQGMYSWNRRAAEQMKLLGADVLTLPYEAREQELNLRGYEDSELIIYGRMPVMISAQCSRKTLKQCRVASGMDREKAGDLVEFQVLRDRKKAEFLEDSHCRFCYTVMYNSVPLWLLDKVPAACHRVRFSFTDESVGTPARILEAFAQGRRKPEGEFTRGHFSRGVE